MRGKLCLRAAAVCAAAVIIAFAACFAACGRSVPIEKPGAVTIGFYDFTGTGFEGRAPTIVRSRVLDDETSEALCRAVNSIKEWDEYTADNMMGFVGEFTVEGSSQIFLFTEDGGILCDELCGRLDDAGTEIIKNIIRGE